MIDFLRRFSQNRLALAGLILLGLVLLVALLAPVISPEDPLRIVGPALSAPFTPGFPLGTDALGRDMLAMLVHGARTTLLIGVAAACTAILIGVTVGAIAGYYGGVVGASFTRLIELFQTIPGLIFLLAVVSFVGPQLIFVVLAIGLISWESIARLTRGEFLTWRKRDFVLAGRTIGMGDLQIIFGEILPNAIGPVLAVSTLSIAGAILAESGLSFLGLGDPSVTTWGRLIGEGRGLIRTAWYVCAIPGVAIVLTVFALSLVSDGLNDVLNPRRLR
ncbi:ABC transporter permease [Phenylobacterium sp. Root77]|jgi:peptide/nickel transport system permease protein|uniref:ABC transporter permease n=1 Tax=unclassified Phenylobacterium TaxID=2640670 RepID=UPI0006F9CFAE|nr:MULTISPECIES: ABC transporter permease [unclassified Phenylobacterium]KQW72814.1 ABC transporter permease [Phenylobacterium sp. Root1277]KQW92031.1 ABC transporter permease [Phenylobacterium sp. Root1290]KRC40263.1 ABC transporter permease [Phenylobacterium sp. Root77]